MKPYESMLCISCREVFDRKAYYKSGEHCPKCASIAVQSIDSWIGVLAFQNGQVVVKSQVDERGEETPPLIPYLGDHKKQIWNPALQMIISIDNIKNVAVSVITPTGQKN